MIPTRARGAPPRIRRKAKLFQGLSEPSRLLILDALADADAPLNVSELGERTGLTQSNTSNHLACLLGCGLVKSQRRGRFVYYRLADEPVARLLSLADRVAGDSTRAGQPCPRCGSRV